MLQEHYGRLHALIAFAWTGPGRGGHDFVEDAALAVLGAALPTYAFDSAIGSRNIPAAPATGDQ